MMTSMIDPAAALDPTALYIPRHQHDSRSAAEPAFPSRRDDPTKTFDDLAAETRTLSEQFETLVQRDRISWEVEYRLVKKLGSGGQGVVFLADRHGAFGSTFRLALKFFQPDGYADAEVYRHEMSRLARLAMRLARIQQDHLLDVYNVIEHHGIQTLVMEWVDGYDLRLLLAPGALEQMRRSTDRDTWEYLNDVIVTESGSQVRLKPGIAVAILRDCLSALAALHREEMLHADIKPANIMVKRTGSCKIVDFGSAFSRHEPSLRPTWTPRYAAVEVLEGDVHTPASDLASLGYVVIEMLSGRFPFADATDGDELAEAKRRLPLQLSEILPADVSRNSMLLNLLHGLIASNPEDRFASAEEADLSEQRGAAEFQRQLIRGDLASEYENDLRLWLHELA
jgi:serine/threonine-protein kinase